MDVWRYHRKRTFFSYTPEVGGGNDGFWPSVNRIIPLCQENMLQNIMAAKLVGKYAVVRDEMPTVIGDQQGYLKFSVERLGMTNADFTVSVIPLEGIEEVGDPVVISNMEILEEKQIH